MKIIIISNNQRIRTAYSDILKSWGHTIEDAIDGIQCLIKITQNKEHFDLIIMELDMVLMNGFEIKGHLIEHRSTVPVILIHGTDKENLILRADQLDFYAVLTLYVGFDVLKKYVDAIEFSIKEKRLPATNIPMLEEINKIALFPISDIFYVEGEDSYTIVYKINNTKLITRKALFVFEEYLADEGFFKTGKRHLINLNFIQIFEKDRNTILMKNAKRIKISNRKLSAFVEEYKKRNRGQ